MKEKGRSPPTFAHNEAEVRKIKNGVYIRIL